MRVQVIEILDFVSMLKVMLAVLFIVVFNDDEFFTLVFGKFAL